MSKFSFCFFLFVIAGVVHTSAQNNVLTEKQYIQGQISVLSGRNMHGRGYVENGRDDAAKYIQEKFKSFNLRTFTKAHLYLQGYDFPINTFPGKMFLSFNKTELTAGKDYIIDPASSSFSGGERLKVEYIDLAKLIIFTKKVAVDNSESDAVDDTSETKTDSLLAKPEGVSAAIDSGAVKLNVAPADSAVAKAESTPPAADSGVIKINKELTDSAVAKVESTPVKSDSTVIKVKKIHLQDSILVKVDPPTNKEDSAIITFNKQLTDSAWVATLVSLDTEHLYIFDHIDSFCHFMHFKPSRFPTRLPHGCYVIPQETKLTWDLSRDTMAATVFYVNRASLPKKIKSAEVEVRSLFLPNAHSDNIIGCVPGAVKDTFITFTAHYDHLGMMGDTTVFPGASDNASGTAMLLYLASYYATHPQHYSILFIAFSGEEPGLMGSAYYVTHPIVPLKNIKFLTNIDIMGDATDGITVVNATEFPNQFSLLQKINDAHNYIPVIKSRGKAANSDHYFFTEKGVPSFFIYSNGGKGYYHDIYDRAHEITLNHIDGVASLLIDFVNELK